LRKRKEMGIYFEKVFFLSGIEKDKFDSIKIEKILILFKV